MDIVNKNKVTKITTKLYLILHFNKAVNMRGEGAVEIQYHVVLSFSVHIFPTFPVFYFDIMIKFNLDLMIPLSTRFQFRVL